MSKRWDVLNDASAQDDYASLHVLWRDALVNYHYVLNESPILLVDNDSLQFKRGCPKFETKELVPKTASSDVGATSIETGSFKQKSGIRVYVYMFPKQRNVEGSFKFAQRKESASSGPKPVDG